jgi:hypothetical protein
MSKRVLGKRQKSLTISEYQLNERKTDLGGDIHDFLILVK